MRSLAAERRSAALAPTPNLYGIKLKRFFGTTREGFEDLLERLRNSKGSSAVHRARREAEKRKAVSA